MAELDSEQYVYFFFEGKLLRVHVDLVDALYSLCDNCDLEVF